MLRLIGLLLLSLSLPAFADTDDGADTYPLFVPVRAAVALLKARDFKALDALVKRYRNPDSLAADGQPNLPAMYDGLSGRCGSCPDHDEGPERERLLHEWQGASPRSTAPALALASRSLELAWEARGSKFASETKDEQWKEMGRYVSDTQRQLDAMPRAARNDPEWYRIQLSLALLAGWSTEKYDQLFNEGIGKFPHFYPLYRAKSKRLQPHWNGSRELRRAFIEESGRRKDIGPMLYTRLMESYSHNEMYRDGFVDWPRMRDGFEAILKAYPNNWDRNLYFRSACLAVDRETAAQQLSLIGDHLIPALWIGYEDGALMSCKTFAENKRCFVREDTKAMSCE